MQRDGANLDGIRTGILVERRGRLASLVINPSPLNSVSPINSNSIRGRIVHIKMYLLFFCILVSLHVAAPLWSGGYFLGGVLIVKKSHGRAQHSTPLDPPPQNSHA